MIKGSTMENMKQNSQVIGFHFVHSTVKTAISEMS